MKNLVLLLLIHGAAIVVSLIVVRDFFRGNKSAIKVKWKKLVKWSVVTSLSLWQVGCWKALSDFNLAFGNAFKVQLYQVGFVVLVVIWVVHQLVVHLRKSNDHRT